MTATGRELRAVHGALALVIGLRIALSPFPSLAGLPDVLFDPPPFLSWLGGMPPLGAIVALQVVGVAGAAVAVRGPWPRVGFAVAWASLLVLAGLRTSLGKILHNDLLLVLAAAPFLWAPAVTGEDRQRSSSAHAVPRMGAMAVIAAAYFFAGWWKLRISGWDWVSAGNIRNLMYEAAATTRAPTDAVALFVGDRAWLSWSLAAATLTAELAAPLLIAWRRTRVAFVAVAGALHAGTWLCLGLDYWTWLAVDAVVLLPWLAWLDRRRRSGGPEPERPGVEGVLVG